MRKYFYCYNSNLSIFLYRNGLKYITKAIHMDTNKIFTMYEQSDELTRLINKYKFESKS